MRIERCRYDDESLDQYIQLFSTCFPNASRLADKAYLRWLYRENPCGPALGYDAWDGDQLAAHYVCVPAMMTMFGVPARSLLSLNTATHPDFQGKGLFTRLAEATYAAASEDGVELVYGVANQNSTPGFTRKLGFSLVASLESRVGFGALGNFDCDAVRSSVFRHEWTLESLQWRMANPAAKVISHLGGGVTGFSTTSGRWGVKAWAELPGDPIGSMADIKSPFGPRIWLGLMPSRARANFGAYLHLPDRLRPSPLNLIVRGLQQPVSIPADDVFFNFLDFDAF